MISEINKPYTPSQEVINAANDFKEKAPRDENSSPSSISECRVAAESLLRIVKRSEVTEMPKEDGLRKTSLQDHVANVNDTVMFVCAKDCRVKKEQCSQKQIQEARFNTGFLCRK